MIISFLNRLLIFLKVRIERLLYPIQLKLAQKSNIIKSNETGEQVTLFKDITIEKVYFPKVHNFITDGMIDFIYPAIELRKYTDAQVYAGSDFVLTKDGAVWDKYFKIQWTKIIPHDLALLKQQKENIYIRKPYKVINVDIGFSLYGVAGTEWSHFLVQFMPKLYLLKEFLNTENHALSVIVPAYKDSQLREMVHTYLSLFNNINIIEINKNESVFCKTLYHIENTAHITDHSNYISPSDIIIPRITLDLLKTNLVDKLLAKTNNIINSNNLESRKLFIGRSGYRNISNYVEIEKYFVDEGFEIIYPHKISLDEKVHIFNEATIIVGPLSSGFTNIIFCKPGVRALAFANFQRIFDIYLSTLANYFSSKIIVITGNDIDDSPHSSYNISLEQIKSAYKELLQ